jgi:hypothetical protein
MGVQLNPQAFWGRNLLPLPPSPSIFDYTPSLPLVLGDEWMEKIDVVASARYRLFSCKLRRRTPLPEPPNAATRAPPGLEAVAARGEEGRS